jgi:hypothetical protein
MNEWTLGGLVVWLVIGIVGVLVAEWLAAAWRRRKVELTPEEEGRADAQRQYEVWKRAQRQAAAFHAEVARLKAEDPERPEGRAS